MESRRATPFSPPIPQGKPLGKGPSLGLPPKVSQGEIGGKALSIGSFLPNLQAPGPFGAKALWAFGLPGLEPFGLGLFQAIAFGSSPPRPGRPSGLKPWGLRPFLFPNPAKPAGPSARFLRKPGGYATLVPTARWPYGHIFLNMCVATHILNNYSSKTFVPQVFPSYYSKYSCPGDSSWAGGALQASPGPFGLFFLGEEGAVPLSKPPWLLRNSTTRTTSRSFLTPSSTRIPPVHY